jgi:hypothetical protein
MSNYTTSAINYYRVNANNAAIATSNSGVGTPTEEIAAPLASPGSFSSYSTAGGLFTIAGSATNFNLFAVNQYLYYTDPSTGDYKLMGQIATIPTSISLTLTTAVVNNPTGLVTPVLSAAYSLITSNESIYMRIATAPTGTPTPGQMLIPNFGLGNWRNGNGLTGQNNPNQSALERVSTIGTPLSSAAATNVPFTFETVNQFTQASTPTLQGATYFRSDADYPSFIWILVTPDNGGNTSLSSQTLYRFTTQENTPAISIFPGITSADLALAGYNNLPTSVSGGGGPNSGN